jgi:hypothetical protein
LGQIEAMEHVGITIEDESLVESIAASNFSETLDMDRALARE